MKNPDPVIHGYSRSVIVGLIETLENAADSFVRESARLPEEEDHYEVRGMKSFVEKYEHPVRLLMEWALIEESIEIVTRHLVAFKDFLGKVSQILNILAPSE